MCGLLERFNPAVRTAREFAGDVWQVNGIRHSPFVSRIPTGVATDPVSYTHLTLPTNSRV